MRYLHILGLSALLTFTLVWIWVAMMPMAFMEPEYASWHAKGMMLDRCDLGSAIILGDSRAAAGILPAGLPLRATNLAVSGGDAIEAIAALDRALDCSVLPRMVIISLAPDHFSHADLFWERSVRFGFMSATDVVALRDASRRIGDFSIYEAHQTDGLPLVIRDWLYQVRFPPLYFSSLVGGGGFLRWQGNQQAEAASLATRGQYYSEIQPDSDVAATERPMRTFQPLPILDYYFDKLLSRLDRRGIQTLFIAMPINETTWSQMKPAMHDRFAAYLADYQSRYRYFHVASDIMPHWPDHYFSDTFSHLNAEGAVRLTAELAQRLQDAPPRTQNEAQNGWLSDTGARASAKVVPISKRGS